MTVIKPQHSRPRLARMTACYGICMFGYGAGMTLSSMGNVPAGLLIVCAATLLAALLFARSSGGRRR